MPEELVKELKVIAQVRGISMIAAQKDSLFVAYKEKYESEKRQQDASLGASRGSGTAKPKKDSTTPNLTRAEHEQMFHEAMARK
jgi:hypothetical protein